MMRTLLKATPLLLSAAILAACVTTNPVSTPGSWQTVGTSADGNITHEINRSSIKRNSNTVTYQDRKTLKDPKKHVNNLPEHKVSINTWEMNCSDKTYRITNSELYDTMGKLIFNDSFNTQNIRPLKVVTGSPVAKQLEQVCK